MIASTPPAHAASLEIDYAGDDSWSSGKDLCAIGLGGPNEAYGVACYSPDGQKLDVLDSSGDGKRVAMEWRGDGRHGLCINSHGKEDDATPYQYIYKGDFSCNRYFDGGRRIAFRVGRCDGSTKDCTKVRNYRKWSDWNTHRI